MATSGVYTYSTSRDQLISAAFRKMGRLGDFETIDTNRLNAGINAINPLAKLYMTYGMPVWKLTSTVISFSQLGTTLGVTIGLTGQTVNQVAPLKVIQALRKDNLAVIDTPMNIYTYEDYELLTNKNAIGAPVHVFYQPLRNSGTAIVWPLPDPVYWQVNGSLYIRYQVPVQDFTVGTDEPDFPIEWCQALIYGLAYTLSPEYGVNPSKRQSLLQDWQMYQEMALSFGTEEGSFLMQPRWNHEGAPGSGGSYT